MDYYVGNGVYDFLSRCKEKENFFWTSGNFWILVYGKRIKLCGVCPAAVFQRLLMEGIPEAFSYGQRGKCADLPEPLPMPAFF